ncbi:MAG: hypothetical protein LBI17_03075 [Rickettsiales bacterium]|jgi:hypothetical protein|nr:hypothetical protein [Rickettsiales bacterium]
MDKHTELNGPRQINIAGISRKRLLELRAFANEVGYAYTFGGLLDDYAQKFSDAEITEATKIFAKFDGRFDIIPVGVPHSGYDRLAVLMALATGKPVADFDMQVEKWIVEKIEAGEVKNKNEVRSSNPTTHTKYGEESGAMFDEAYAAMQSLGWADWTGAVASGIAVPLCNAGKILQLDKYKQLAYPALVDRLKKAGKVFVNLSVAHEKYPEIARVNAHTQSNWKKALDDDAKASGSFETYAIKRYHEVMYDLGTGDQLIGAVKSSPDTLGMLRELSALQSQINKNRADAEYFDKHYNQYKR